jgi:hypothetical protein
MLSSTLYQVTKFISRTCWVHVVKYTLPSHQVHIMNLLSPCCQVHFAKSRNSFHELIESTLSSPRCQDTKFVSLTCWVHIVRSMSPITNSMSSWPRYHVDCMNVFLTWQKYFLIYKLLICNLQIKDAWNWLTKWFFMSNRINPSMS